MKNLESLKVEIASMAAVSLKMLELTHKAFMEHNTERIEKALEEESIINKMEENITIDLVDIGRSCVKESERENALILVGVVSDLEIIGDYCKDILERVQIKIEEKLLFSEEAVLEYNNLYSLTEKELIKIVDALEKNDFKGFGDILKNKKAIDKLVEEYRKNHNQRLLNGVCIPIACNMFSNMLDFTAAIYYRVNKIAEVLLKIK